MAQQLINGKQQFIDGNGNPLAGGSVAFYAPGTLNPVNTWQNQALTVLNSNPVVLDANGMASIWGATALYREIVQNAAGVQMWDEVVGLLSVTALTLAQINALITDQGPIICSDQPGLYAWNGSQYVTSGQTVSSIAGIRKLPKAGTPYIVASGYYAQGDGGGGTYLYDPTDTTSPDNGGTVIVATDGGRWKLVNNGEVSLRQFGAKGDGVTDDTAAVAACVTAMQGGTVLSPAGSFLLKTASSGALVTITNAVRIRAVKGSVWLVDPSVASTVDVIEINPAVNAVEGIEFDGLWIYQASGTPARDVVRINLSATAGLKNLRVHNCLFRAMAGAAINCLNPGEANSNGLFLSSITESTLDGAAGSAAINLLGLGDSNVIADCVISGTGAGINATMLSPSAPSGTSAKFAILRNNITAQQGAIIINRGRGVLIEGNNIEQTVLSPVNACVQLGLCDYDDLGVSIVRANKIEPADGVAQCGALSIFECKATIVEGNQLSTSSKTSSFTSAVSIASCTNVKVIDNDFYLSTNCIGVNTDSTSHNTYYRRGKLDTTTGNSEFNDAGVGSKGVPKFPTFQNSWANAGSTLPNTSWTKDIDNYVHLDGVVTGSIVTSNTVIFQLPTGFTPQAQENFITHELTAGGVFGPATVRVDADGSVRLRNSSGGAAGLTELSLCGISFYAPEN